MCNIGHDVAGWWKNCLLAAQVRCVAGGTKIGDGGNSLGAGGVNKTIVIGDGAVVMGQAGVTSSIAGGKTYWGTPIEDFMRRGRS